MRARSGDAGYNGQSFGGFDQTQVPVNFKLGDAKNTLQIHITPLKVAAQSTTNTTISSLSISKVGQPYVFLAPNNIMTDTLHQWENYDSLGTRFIQKKEGMMKTFRDTKTTFEEGIKNGSVTGNVVTQKLDTPQTFKDSSRRQLNVTIQLLDQNNPRKNVFQPVRDLQLMSCAEKTGQFDFKMPWIFKVETKPSDIIVMNRCALTSVQPTFSHPYIEGYPSKAELALVFIDLLPLYQNSFKRSIG